MLLPNNVYTLSIKVGGETLSTQFLSAFDPAYTTPSRIRARYGPLVREASDLDLWVLIYDASLEIDYITRDIEDDQINVFARERVASCRAALAWLKQHMVFDAWNQINRRQLADLSVSSDGDGPDLLELLDRLSEDCKKWTEELLGPIKARGWALSSWAERLPSMKTGNRSWT